MTTNLTEIASARGLVILVDLDTTSTLANSVDDELISMLRALQATRVRIVLVSARSRDALDPLRSKVPGAWWSAEGGTWCLNDREWFEQPLIAWVREQSQEAVLLALRGASSDGAFSARRDEDVVVVGGSDVRDLLEWIAAIRFGG